MGQNQQPDSTYAHHSETLPRIAFLGLGAMGQRMARRLLDAGHPLTVYNRTPARAESLVAAGATLASTPRDAANGADVVIAMVTDDDAARQVWLHPETGACLGLSTDAIAIEASTVTPAWIDVLGERLDADGFALLDAPVAGSRPQAEAGQLVFFVGGDADAVTQVAPILGRMGHAIHSVGPRGHGAKIKLAVNAFFAVQIAGLAEVLGMLSRAGVDAAPAMEVLGSLPITSPALRGIGGLMTAGKFDPMFPIDLVAKDLSYAVLTAEAAQGSMPAVRAARDEYRRASESGYGGENIHAIARLYLTARADLSDPRDGANGES